MSGIPAKKSGNDSDTEKLASNKPDDGTEVATTTPKADRTVSVAQATASSQELEDATGNERLQTSSDTLNDLRIRFGNAVGNSYWMFAIIIPIFIVFLIALLSGIIPKTETIDRLALSTSLLVGLGIYLGFMSLYFGVMMTWLGIESAFTLSAQGKGGGKEAQLTLSSASPGLLFGLMGGVMIVVCLYKTIEYSVKDNTSQSAQEVIDKGKPNRIGPEKGVYPPKQDATSK